ncbi:MAG: CDP-archaeol synthase [Candidatus Thalassarchaeaceae archaeon]|nr:CDP-archaeol synthase [Candidatus Thalassarchaeaceae archaeon]
MAGEPWTGFGGIILVLWLYLPGYLANTGAMLGGKWIPEVTGWPIIPIDAGRVLSDGNRILGDGKTWNGLLGAVLCAGFLGLFTHWIGSKNSVEGDSIFLDPLTWSETTSWFWIGGEWGAAFIVGACLGFGCMIGDMGGSFIKRRRGLKREGDVSSSAPLLDTLPFAVLTFGLGLLLFPGILLGDSVLFKPMLYVLILTPIIHRITNIIGHKLGLKEVPY